MISVAKNRMMQWYGTDRYSMVSMLRFTKLLIASFALAWLYTSACLAKDPAGEKRPARFEAEVDFSSRYVWRGIANSSGSVMQPSINFLVRPDLSVNYWGNCNLNTESGVRRCNESNLTITYSREWNKITFEPSVQSYLYPDNPDTAEAILAVTYPLKSTEVFTRHAFDLVSFRGSYFGEAGIGWQKEFGRRLELSASVSAGWGNSRFNDAYLGLATSTFSVVSANVAVSWRVAGNLHICPHMNLSSLVDRKLRHTVNEPDLRWAGVTVGFGF